MRNHGQKQIHTQILLENYEITTDEILRMYESESNDPKEDIYEITTNFKKTEKLILPRK